MELIHRGKVRDVYDAGDGNLLLVASDRLSAFDVVMAEPVPDKGRLLTAMSVFWFEFLGAIAPNHLVRVVDGRSLLVRRARMLPVECIVRGYLAGSAWAEYRRTATVNGHRLATGMREADRLPEPLFTPSTKAAVGEHDEPLDADQTERLLGRDVAAQARDMSLALYGAAAAHAASCGLLLADTKFELGWVDGRLVVADEALTPDSSRFWEASAWAPGTAPPSYDKQPVRDQLAASGWDKRPPAPPLTPDTIAATRARYLTAYERLSGRRFADWPD